MCIGIVVVDFATVTTDYDQYWLFPTKDQINLEISRELGKKYEYFFQER